MIRNKLKSFLQKHSADFKVAYLAGMTYPALMHLYKLSRFEVIAAARQLGIKRKVKVYISAGGTKHKFGVRGSVKKDAADAKAAKGKIILSHGYKYILTGKFIKSAAGKRRHEKVLLHRYLMEQKLKRKLRKDEWVRFKDGDKNNCVVSNLYVVKPSYYGPKKKGTK